MIRHIVMWKLDASYTNEEKSGFLKEFSKKLLGLEGKIKELKTISLHYNSKDADGTNYDLLLDTTFNSLDDLKVYVSHPSHAEVVEFSKTFKKVRACVDFEFE